MSNVVKIVYPEAATYLNEDSIFDDEQLENYFKEYRNLKLTSRITQEFYNKAQLMSTPCSVLSRDAIVQKYFADDECALLVVDAMGAEWLPMLMMLAQKRNLGIESIAIGEANLPTTTQFNNIHWSYSKRRLPDIKNFDNIAHNGAEMHEMNRVEDNLAAALDVIGTKVLPSVAAGLARFERVLLTADHGSSRLAMLAWQAEPKFAQTLAYKIGMEITDWRYCKRVTHEECPPELEETLDGEHWVVRGYDRLPKKGGGQGFELHGGATLEERLVPVVIFSKVGQFIPKLKTGSKQVQIVEKDDFDL